MIFKFCFIFFTIPQGFARNVNFLRLLECNDETSILMVLISLTKYSRVSQQNFKGRWSLVLGSSANFVGVIANFFIR